MAVPTEIEKFTLLRGVTFTLEKERVICVRCSELMLVAAALLLLLLLLLAPPDWPVPPCCRDPVAPEVPLPDPGWVLCCEPEP